MNPDKRSSGKKVDSKKGKTNYDRNMLVGLFKKMKVEKAAYIESRNKMPDR